MLSDYFVFFFFSVALYIIDEKSKETLLECELIFINVSFLSLKWSKMYLIGLQWSANITYKNDKS